MFGVSWKSGPDQPIGRLPVAFSTASIEARMYSPLLVLRHADMDDLPARQPVRDELGVALQALLDQERIVVGDGLIERQGRFDAVLVQHGEDAEDPDPVAIFVVAVAADVGELRLVAGPQPLGTAHRAHRQRRTGRHLPVPVLQVDDDRKGDAGIVRPAESGARDNRGPGIKILIHAVGSFCGHGSTPSPFAPNYLVPDYDTQGNRHKFAGDVEPRVGLR